MDTFQIEGVLGDPALVAELHGRLDGAGAGAVVGGGVGASTPAALIEPSAAERSGRALASASVGRRGRAGASTTDRASTAADALPPPGDAPAPPLHGPLADVLARPTLLVGPTGFELPAARTWQERLLPWGRRLVDGAAAVGRLEGPPAGAVPGELFGTAVLVAETVAVTAPAVAERVRRALEDGQPVRIGFGATRLTPNAPGADVVRSLVAVSPGTVGVVVLAPAVGTSLPAPLALLDAGADAGAAGGGDWVALVACPAEPGAADPRRPLSAPKRLAPGAWRDDGHDATALPGSDGAAVLDVGRGALLGLHLEGSGGGAEDGSGAAVEGHRAPPVVGSRAIAEAVRAAVPEAGLVVQLGTGLGPSAAGEPPELVARTDGSVPPTAAAAPRLTPGDLADRRGYDPSFLGGADLTVALPVVPPPLDRQVVVV